jgi:hypothetical protein
LSKLKKKDGHLGMMVTPFLERPQPPALALSWPTPQAAGLRAQAMPADLVDNPSSPKLAGHPEQTSQRENHEQRT